MDCATQKSTPLLPLLSPLSLLADFPSPEVQPAAGVFLALDLATAITCHN